MAEAPHTGLSSPLLPEMPLSFLPAAALATASLPSSQLPPSESMGSGSNAQSLAHPHGLSSLPLPAASQAGANALFLQALQHQQQQQQRFTAPSAVAPAAFGVNQPLFPYTLPGAYPQAFSQAQLLQMQAQAALAVARATPQVSVPKVKVLLTYGGASTISVAGAWDYVGGETRLLGGLDPTRSSYTDLADRIEAEINTRLGIEGVLRYELPGSPGTLVDVKTSQDVENMWSEWQDFCKLSKQATFKLHLYVDKLPMSSGSCHSSQNSQDRPSNTTTSGSIPTTARNSLDRAVETAEGEGHVHTVVINDVGRDTPQGSPETKLDGKSPGQTAATALALSGLAPAVPAPVVPAPVTPTPRLPSNAGSSSPAPSALKTPEQPAALSPSVASFDRLLTRVKNSVEIIRPADLRIVRFVGSGGFADCYLAKWLGVEVAVKCLRDLPGAHTSSKAAVKELLREASVLAGLRHPNVLCLYAVALPDQLSIEYGVGPAAAQRAREQARNNSASPAGSTSSPPRSPTQGVKHPPAVSSKQHSATLAPVMEGASGEEGHDAASSKSLSEVATMGGTNSDKVETGSYSTTNSGPSPKTHSEIEHASGAVTLNRNCSDEAGVSTPRAFEQSGRAAASAGVTSPLGTHGSGQSGSASMPASPFAITAAPASPFSRVASGEFASTRNSSLDPHEKPTLAAEDHPCAEQSKRSGSDEPSSSITGPSTPERGVSACESAPSMATIASSQPPCSPTVPSSEGSINTRTLHTGQSMNLAQGMSLSGVTNATSYGVQSGAFSLGDSSLARLDTGNTSSGASLATAGTAGVEPRAPVPAADVPPAPGVGEESGAGAVAETGAVAGMGGRLLLHPLDEVEGEMMKKSVVAAEQAAAASADVESHTAVSEGLIQRPALVAEFLSGCSIHSAIKRKADFLSSDLVLVKVAMDASRGMEYCHGKHIIHWNLKLGNLIVGFSSDKVPLCKVADIGLGRPRQLAELDDDGVARVLPWAAPELVRYPSTATEKVDVYSFGMILWSLWARKFPYDKQDIARVFLKTMQGQTVRTPLPGTPEWEAVYPGEPSPKEPAPGWSDLLQRCWDNDPCKRPPFSEISNAMMSLFSAAKAAKRAARAAAKAHAKDVNSKQAVN